MAGIVASVINILIAAPHMCPTHRHRSSFLDGFYSDLTLIQVILHYLLVVSRRRLEKCLF